MVAKNYNLVIEIVRFVKEDFPGWVECKFADVNGRRHTLVDKVPIFGLEALSAASKYQRPASPDASFWSGGKIQGDEN